MIITNCIETMTALKSLKITGLIFGLLATTSLSIPAQSVPSEALYAGDVASLDAILETLYRVISGDRGEPRDWERFKNLFHPEAKLIPSRTNDTGKMEVSYLSPPEYIERSGPYLEGNGFFEKEISRKVERFGSLVHVWSTYESRHQQDDPQPFSRGINSIQLLNDGSRWWIVNIYWTPETDTNPLPPSYLPD